LLFIFFYIEPNKDLFIQLAQNTLTVFGVGQGSGLVVLSPGYPTVLVPPSSMLKTDMDNCDFKGGRIFKRLVKCLIIDSKVWSRNVGSFVLNSYPNQIGACFGKLIINILFAYFISD
jgi:hypothetical protein